MITNTMNSNLVAQILQNEFNKIGIRLYSTNIEVFEVAPMHKNNNSVFGIVISFNCLEDEFRYIKPLLYGHVEKLKPINSCYDFSHVAPSNEIFRDASTIAGYKTYREYECTIKIYIEDKNTIVHFIETFREKVKPLYEVIESRRFDEEVEKMLTEDRYNN